MTEQEQSKLEQARKDKEKRQNELHWYVLFVKPQHELRLWEYFTGKQCPDRRHIAKKDRHGNKIPDPVLDPAIDAFVPYRLERRQWSDRVKVLPRLVLPGVVFVRVKQTERSRLFVDDAVHSYLFDRDRQEPALVEDSQLEAFRLAVDEKVDVSMTIPVPGETVKIISGPFKGMIGELVRRLGENKPKFQITLTGQYAFQMDIEMDNFVVVPKGTLPDIYDIKYK